jgi:hypothetical protein
MNSIRVAGMHRIFSRSDEPDVTKTRIPGIWYRDNPRNLKERPDSEADRVPLLFFYRTEQRDGNSYTRNLPIFAVPSTLHVNDFHTTILHLRRLNELIFCSILFIQRPILY